MSGSTGLNRMYPSRTTRGLSRWRAKRRGQGTTTKELIKLMASSFTGGEVDVREPKGQYLVEIEFIGTWGVPPNVDDLGESIREVLPAHLDLTRSTNT